MTDEVKNVLYIARTPDPIYWSAGWHTDGPLHAIASARENYGSSGDVYMVFKGAVGTTVNGMGGFTYPRDADEPKLEGIYDAAGNWLGTTLAKVAKEFAKGEFYGEHCLDDKTIKALKRHATEAA